MQITLNLPEKLVDSARLLGEATARDVAAVLVDTLEMLIPTLESQGKSNIFPEISTLSDQEILDLADAKMDEVQNQRLGTLQAKGKATSLTEAESYELLILLHIYQIGQLRKSQALAEVVRRHLRSPLSV